MRTPAAFPGAFSAFPPPAGVRAAPRGFPRFPGMNVFRLLLPALAAAACILWGSASPAQEAGDPDVSRQIGDGRAEETGESLDSRNLSPADRLFLTGRALKAEGRLPEAIRTFRDVLQIDPNHINARRELAHTLLLNRDFGPAEFHFRELLRIDGNENMRSGYRRFLRIIDENRPVGISGFFSILPSTNVNRGTDNRVIVSSIGGQSATGTISDESRRKSGTGVSLGLSGYFRAPSSPSSRLSLYWRLSGIRYEDTLFNSTTLNLSLIHEETTRKGGWSAGPYFRRNYVEAGSDSDAHGVRFGMSRNLNDKNQLNFSLSHEYVEYSLRAGSDGPFTRATVSLRHQVKPSVSLVGGVAASRSVPDREANQYFGREVFGDVTRTWRGGLRTTAGFGFGDRRYDGLFPFSTFAREDDYTRVTLSAQHSRIDIRGFTPQVYCSRTENRSNIATSEYGATDCQVIISRNF